MTITLSTNEKIELLKSITGSGGLRSLMQASLIPFIKTNDTKSTNYCPF